MVREKTNVGLSLKWKSEIMDGWMDESIAINPNGKN